MQRKKLVLRDDKGKAKKGAAGSASGPGAAALPNGGAPRGTGGLEDVD